MNSPFLWSFLVYVIGLTVYGWWSSRRTTGGDDFLLCGRSLPYLLTLGTTVATMVGTGSSMGAVSKGYAGGWAGSLFGIGGAIGIFLLAKIFSSLRNSPVSSMGEELSAYVGGSRAVRVMVSVFVVLSSIAWLGAHLLGGAKYLAFAIPGLDPVLARGLVAAGFGIYAVLGGYRAVVVTDSIQAIVLFTGFVVTAGLAVALVGGPGELASIQSQISQTNGSPQAIPSISLVCLVAVGILGTPSFRQRIYSGKSASSISRAFQTSGALYLGFSLLPAVVGMCAFRLVPGLEDHGMAFPAMATEVLPQWAGVLVLIAGLSATMSSASSDAIASVTSILGDLHMAVRGHFPRNERMILLSRISLSLTILVAFGMSMVTGSIMDYLELVITVFMTGLTVMALLGKLWPRYTSSGAIASLITAFITALTIRYTESFNQFWGNSTIPTVLVSGITGVVVSLLTPPQKLSFEKSADQNSRISTPQ